MPRFSPLYVRGSMTGLLASYWFGVAAILIIVAALSRTKPGVAMTVLLGSLVILLIVSAFANGTTIEVTDDDIIVRRRMRDEWVIAHRDLEMIDEHIPLRPRARSLAGWVFRNVDGDKATIEIAMFSPRDRRRLRETFADVIVSRDRGGPRGLD